jgi:hypothetical protein
MSAKYTHSKLDLYIRADAEIIKSFNSLIPIEEILNSLSQIFGWSDYNELTKYSRKEPLSFCDKNNEIFNIESLSNSELSSFQHYYIKEIERCIPISEDYFCGSLPYEDLTFFDHYSLREYGLFYNHENTKEIVLKQSNNDALNISDIHNDLLLIFTNDEFKVAMYYLFEEYNDSLTHSSYLGNISLKILDGIFTILENNNVEIWQNEFCKYLNLDNYIIEAQKNTIKQKVRDEIADSLVNIPSFVDIHNYFEGSTKSNRTMLIEQYNRIMAPFYILEKDSCIKINLQNKIRIKYKLKELKDNQKTIIFKYHDNQKNNYICKLLTRMMNDKLDSKFYVINKNDVKHLH